MTTSEFEFLGTIECAIGGDREHSGVMKSDVYSCSRCGSVVTDKESHDRWHTMNMIGMG